MLEQVQAEAIPFPVTNPERIPVERYYDAAFFELERQKLWPHVWQMACRLEEIPEIGDFVEYKILEKSVVLVRTQSGVKAFHNVCRHRGVKLANGRGNCKTKGFICPFHGWRWNMDGDNTFVFGKQMFSEENLAKAEIDLKLCRVEFWGGCAFINFDDNAPPLLQSLGPVAERLSARNVENLKMEWWYATVLPTNWKLAMEAFMEGYHTMRTHPQLHAVSMPEVNTYGLDAGMAPRRTSSSREFADTAVQFVERLSDGMAGMVHGTEVEIARSLRDEELPEDVMTAAGVFYTRLRDEIRTRGRAQGLPVPDLNELAAKYPFHAVEFIFPHYFLLPFFSAMSSYRIRPLTAETCLFEIWSLALLPDDDARLSVTEPIILPYDSQAFPEIPRQDYSNLPLQQEGLHGGGFEFMRLARSVEGLISNYQRLIDGYLRGVNPEMLVAASCNVNGGIDAQIKNIGI